MSLINSYATPVEFLQWVTPQDTSADPVDDQVVASVLEAVSRYIDEQTGRQFYPSVVTQNLSIPSGSVDDNILEFDLDVLEVISFLNGNGDTITSSEYDLLPLNASPKNALRIIPGAGAVWELDSNGNSIGVLDLAAFVGYHDNYTVRGWASVGTLGAAMSDTTTASLTMTAGHTLRKDTIIKVDNEIMQPSVVATNAVTLQARGDNGSTAATHSNGATVYQWRVMGSVRETCLMVSQNIWRRFGNKSGSYDENIVTASGVVITPRDVPSFARHTIRALTKIL